MSITIVGNSPDLLVINQKLISTFGLNTAAFISNLFNEHYICQQFDMSLQEDGSFSITMEEQSKRTGLSIYQLRKCKKELINKGIIETYMKGIPAKEFYLLYPEKLEGNNG